MVGPFPFPLTALNPPMEGMCSLVAAGAGETTSGGGTAGEAVLGESDRFSAALGWLVFTANVDVGCSALTDVVRGETA